MTITEINALDRDAFVERIGWIFENSPWVAQRAWNWRPFADKAALQQRLLSTMWQSERKLRLELLQAHPDLGAKAQMSAASTSEQAGAGLDQLTREEFDELHALNSEYKQKFGFPFLYAVKGSTKHDILGSLRRRLASTPDQEFREALAQVNKIAVLRLEGLIEDGTVS